VAALEVFGSYRVETRADAPCELMVLQARQPRGTPAVEGWRVIATLRRPTDRTELTWVLRRER
jgi:hypothetical protein